MRTITLVALVGSLSLAAVGREAFRAMWAHASSAHPDAVAASPVLLPSDAAGGPVSLSQGGSAAHLLLFVQRILAPRVWLLDKALATADRQVLVYCAARHLPISLCFEQSVDVQAPTTQALGQVLTQQALVLTAVSAELSVVHMTSRGVTLPSWQMERLSEDLAVWSAQLADLLQDYARAITLASQSPTPHLNSEGALAGLAYGPRVRGAVTILRRAEAWLESIDHETGVHVTLPGFAAGAPSLENQLAMP